MGHARRIRSTACGGSWCIPPPTPKPPPKPAAGNSTPPAPTWTPSRVPPVPAHHPDTTAVTAKAAQITRRRRIGGYLHTAITTSPAGKPVFAWSFDQTAIDAQAATDGWYALLTNLDASIDAGEILHRYKGQPAVERRYGTIKGPLAVAPIFLQNNRRIAALITVICLALLIFCLIEREVRATLTPDTDIRGFYTDSRAAPPTGHLILQALGELRLIPAHNGQPPKIPQPGHLQAKLLTLLKVDPTQPRGS